MKQNKKNLLEVIKKRPNAVVAIVASISIAIVGYVLLATFAADAPHVEVETATITGNAEKVEDLVREHNAELVEEKGLVQLKCLACGVKSAISINTIIPENFLEV